MGRGWLWWMIDVDWKRIQIAREQCLGDDDIPAGHPAMDVIVHRMMIFGSRVL